MVPSMPMHPYMHAQMHPATYFASELLYALIIVFTCLFIYAKTRELYALSGHKGIRLFREVFFFFALAYILRLVPMFLRAANVQWSVPQFGFYLGLYLFGYASTMVIISMGRSIAWKRLQRGLWDKSYAYHVFSLALPLTIFVGRTIIWFFIAQSALIVATFIVAFINHRNRRSKSKGASTYYTYVLLLLFWLLNVAIMTIPKYMQDVMYTLYALSIALFITIMFKVNARVRG